MKFLPGRRVLVGLAVAAASMVGLVTSAGTANASTISVLSQAPTAECYATQVVADKVYLLQNVGSIRWEPELEGWNGSAWVFLSWGNLQTINTNTPLSQLIPNSETFNVTTGHYYRVFDWFSLNGSAWGYVLDQHLRNAPNPGYCYAG